MYYEWNFVLALTVGFPSTDKFRYFITHPCVQLPLQEFINDYFGTNRDIGSIEDRGWYPVLCGMAAVNVDKYTWPHQVKNGWVYERHVARFICQVYYRAERSGLPWWQRTDYEDDYAIWGYQLYELLLYLCRVWLEEQAMPRQTLNQKGPGDKPKGVAHHDAVGDQDDYLLDIRHLFTEEAYRADQDLAIGHGTADDGLPLTEETELHTKGDTDSDDEIVTAGTSSGLLRRCRAVASSRSLRGQYLAGPRLVTGEEDSPNHAEPLEDQHCCTSHVGTTVATDVVSDGISHDPQSSLKRRSAITASLSLSSGRNGQVNRAASKMEVFDGPWTTCPLPWRRAGPDNW